MELIGEYRSIKSNDIPTHDFQSWKDFAVIPIPAVGIGPGPGPGGVFTISIYC